MYIASCSSNVHKKNKSASQSDSPRSCGRTERDQSLKNKLCTDFSLQRFKRFCVFRRGRTLQFWRIRTAHNGVRGGKRRLETRFFGVDKIRFENAIFVFFFFRFSVRSRTPRTQSPAGTCVSYRTRGYIRVAVVKTRRNRDVLRAGGGGGQRERKYKPRKRR